MTKRELAVSLNDCVDNDRGYGYEWDVDKAEGMLGRFAESVRKECADRAVRNMVMRDYFIISAPPDWADTLRAAIMGEE